MEVKKNKNTLWNHNKINQIELDLGNTYQRVRHWRPIQFNIQYLNLIRFNIRFDILHLISKRYTSHRNVSSKPALYTDIFIHVSSATLNMVKIASINDSLSNCFYRPVEMPNLMGQRNFQSKENNQTLKWAKVRILVVIILVSEK